MMPSRAQLPDWPRLMSDHLAADYLSISETTFRTLDIKCQRIGRRILWDRVDIDRFVERMKGQPLTVDQEADEAAEIERRFLERRRRG